MNILIINLTRFGDLLQTQPVVSGLSDQGHCVGLACLEQFSPAAGLLADVKFVFPFPGARLLKGLDENWPEALSALHTWRSELCAVFRPDIIVNLTPTLSARMLTRYLCGDADALGKEENSPADSAGGTGSPEFMGFGVDSFGFMENSSAWATYLQAASRTRGNSPCNLVDVFRKVCGLGKVPPRYELRSLSEAEMKELRNELETNALKCIASVSDRYGEHPGWEENSGFRGFVGFQLGASDDRRRWPTGFFARLGDLLWNELGLLPLLLGSEAEKHLGARYAAQAHSPCLSLLGATDLPGLAGALSLCELLVTNDTGTMHLAAGLRLPVLALFLATAQAWDTAPYQEGALCLEPDLPDHPRPFDNPCEPGCPCRTAIAPETVFRFARARLESGQWPDACGDDGPVRAWLTERGHMEADPEGFLNLRSLSGHEHTRRSFWLRSQRYFLRLLLDGMLSDNSDLAVELPVYLTDSPELLPQEFLSGLRAELEQAAALLHLLGEQGLALSVNPLPILKNRFMGTWQRLQSLWDNSENFNVLGLLWMAQTQEQGDALDKVLALARQYGVLCKLWAASLTPVLKC
ncbi:MAG: glycosyltransferase family 9 protein [Desulfovibrionaceae bacterium]|nr:glycosyltransferase family 9 protein [Desulfovibrionaceae bacterium]